MGDRARLPAALEPLFAGLGVSRATGVVTAVRSSVQKRVVVEDGNVVFAASSDPRDLIGQALLRARLITEKDLVEALSASNTAASGTGAPRLAAALTAMRRVTPEQCTTVFESKMRETVLDLFLWDSGAIAFEVEPLAGGVPFPLKIPLDGLVAEGARRRARWAVVRRVLLDPQIAFERVGASWGEGFPKSPGDKRLAEFIEKGLTLGQILAELRGQDYAVSVRLASLVQSRVLRTVRNTGFVVVEPEVEVGSFPEGDVPGRGGVIPGAVSEISGGEFTKAAPLPTEPAKPLAAPPPAAARTPAQSLALARARFEEGKLDEAHAVVMECVAADPMAAMEGWEILQKVEAALVARARAKGIRDDAKYGLARPISTQIGKQLPPSEAFVMSRFAGGAMTVGSLLAVCPFQPHEVLGILERWIADGTVSRR